MGATNPGSILLGFLHFILSPTLRQVNFMEGDLSSTLFCRNVLPLITHCTTSIQRMVLTSTAGGSAEELSKAILENITGQELTSLEVRLPKSYCSTYSVINQLRFKAQKLRSLVLDIHDSNHAGPAATTGSESSGAWEMWLNASKSFPALISLHLICRLGASICGCYPPWLVKKATAITFYLPAPNTLNAQSFSQVLTALGGSEILKIVNIVTLNDSSLSVDAIVPVLKFQGLQEFVLDIFGLQEERSPEPGSRILHKLVDGVASMTPRSLRTLVIPRCQILRDNWSTHTYPPVSSLIYIAKHVPELTKLSLAIDSSARPDNETLKSLLNGWDRLTAASNLLHLEVLEMRQAAFGPRECLELARLLDAIFPQLMSITMARVAKRSTGWDEAWEVVEENRKMCKEIRLWRGMK